MTVDLHHEEAGTGPAVVLLHAFPLSSAMWDHQRASLADGWRIVTPDLRGFGGSELGDDEPSLTTAADDVARLLDRLGVERVVLGGLSMGGYVAMAFLRRHSQRVRALVLADTKATADPPAAREKRERIAARLDAEQHPAALVEEVLPALCGETTARERPEVLAKVRALVEAAPPTAAAWAQRAMAVRPDSVPVLRSVHAPAIIVLGEEDSLSTREDAETMTEALPDARSVVLPGAGHLTALEVPQEFTAVLRSFLLDLG